MQHFLLCNNDDIPIMASSHWLWATEWNLPWYFTAVWSIVLKIYRVWFRTPSYTSMGYWPVIFLGAICQFEQILSLFCDLSWQQGYFAYKPATDWKLFCLIVHTFCWQQHSDWSEAIVVHELPNRMILFILKLDHLGSNITLPIVPCGQRFTESLNPVCLLYTHILFIYSMIRCLEEQIACVNEMCT